MIGLDTNVLVRYLVQDDPKQARAASRLIAARTASDRAFVSLIVLVELWWVLRSAYGYSRDEVTGCLNGLLDSVEVAVEQHDAARAALRMTEDGADFADALIAQVCTRTGCTGVMTFDRGAAKRAGMTQLR